MTNFKSGSTWLISKIAQKMANFKNGPKMAQKWLISKIARKWLISKMAQKG